MTTFVAEIIEISLLSELLQDKHRIMLASGSNYAVWPLSPEVSMRLLVANMLLLVSGGMQPTNLLSIKERIVGYLQSSVSSLLWT